MSEVQRVNRKGKMHVVKYEDKLLPVGARSKCRYCGKELAPFFHLTSNELQRGMIFEIVVHETFRGEYGYMGNGSFCSLRCGYYWAVDQARKGRTK